MSTEVAINGLGRIGRAIPKLANQTVREAVSMTARG
jgi:glyceraldehyde-3-phosphate dehydrogenase/erythrose-4-phosphate dehydrogenase